MFTHKLYLKVLVTYLAEVQAFYTNQSWSAYLLGLALRENTLGNKQFLKEFINHIQTENVADQDEISNATLYKLFSFLLRHKYTDDGDLLIDKFDKAIGWSVNDSWTSPIPQDMSYMVKYFETCNEENISTFPLFCQLMSLCKQPHGISNLDSVLYGMRRSKSIFTADNLILAIQYLKGNHRHELAWALDHMREYNLLPQDNPQLAQANFTLLLRNPARAGTEAANFRALFNFQLFNQANFEACMKHPCPGFILFLAYGCRERLTQANLDLFFAKPELAAESIKWYEYNQNNHIHNISSESLKREIETFEKGQAKKLLLDSTRHSPRLFTQPQNTNDIVFDAEAERLRGIGLS